MGPNDDEDQQEKTLSQVYDRLPEGRTPLDILKKKDERERIGKSEQDDSGVPITPHLTLPGLLPYLILLILTYGTFSIISPPGKAHIRRAIQGHEEALRIYGLCHHLNKLEVLQDILKASHQRSLNKYSENENEEEFTDYTEAPDIICESVF